MYNATRVLIPFQCPCVTSLNAIAFRAIPTSWIAVTRCIQEIRPPHLRPGGYCMALIVARYRVAGCWIARWQARYRQLRLTIDSAVSARVSNLILTWFAVTSKNVKFSSSSAINEITAERIDPPRGKSINQRLIDFESRERGREREKVGGRKLSVR